MVKVILGVKGVQPGTPPQFAYTPTMTGTPKEYEVVEPDYEFTPHSPSDNENFVWYRSDTPSVVGQEVIVPTIPNRRTCREEDVGKYLRCEITGNNQNGTTTDSTDWIGPIEQGDVPQFSVPASLSGEAKVGNTLTTNYDVHDTTQAETFVWERADYTEGTPPIIGTPSVIGGAVNITYALQPADETKVVRCTVTATNANGSTDSVTVWKGPVEAASVIPTRPSTYNDYYSKYYTRMVTNGWAQHVKDGTSYGNVWEREGWLGHFGLASIFNDPRCTEWANDAMQWWLLYTNPELVLGTDSPIGGSPGYYNYSKGTAFAWENYANALARDRTIAQSRNAAYGNIGMVPSQYAWTIKQGLSRETAYALSAWLEAIHKCGQDPAIYEDETNQMQAWIDSMLAAPGNVQAGSGVAQPDGGHINQWLYGYQTNLVTGEVVPGTENDHRFGLVDWEGHGPFMGTYCMMTVAQLLEYQPNYITVPADALEQCIRLSDAHWNLMRAEYEGKTGMQYRWWTFNGGNNDAVDPSPSTVLDVSKVWTTNEWVGHPIRCQRPPGTTLGYANVVSNTNNTLVTTPLLSGWDSFNQTPTGDEVGDWNNGDSYHVQYRSSSTQLTADLGHNIFAGMAWLYWITGYDRFRQRAELMFENGNGNYGLNSVTTGMKQFNDALRYTAMGLDWYEAGVNLHG